MSHQQESMVRKVGTQETTESVKANLIREGFVITGEDAQRGIVFYTSKPLNESTKKVLLG